MSNHFWSVFSQRHAVLPVIHVESLQQALRNAVIAHGAGCDGIFLINHNVSHFELMDIHRTVAAEFPEWWIGINSLGRQPASLFAELPESVAGLWTDNAGIDERSKIQQEADQIDAVRNVSDWRGLYFGGVAFKYQREVANVKEAARIAMRYLDVVTTSGPGTGAAAPREKIAEMKENLGEFPLAIASGITPENVQDYLDIADCFLVATGISISFTELDPLRVARLIDIIRGADVSKSPTRKDD